MKLFYSATSPYVRKVMACAIARGIDGQIERVACNPHLSAADLTGQNPLSKVPTLTTEDGLALYDSPVICEFLDSIGEARPMFPEHGAARWRALKLQALGDGILDASVPRRAELAKSQDEGRIAWIARQEAIVARSLDALEADPPHHGIDIGTISIAAALGYLDFRFAHQPWREGRPRLAAWYAAIAAEPCIAATAPPPG
ncbi:MAG: glutathione S-transferase N-terminal domain-containing protein [Rhodospirillales bacterium]|nr:glutathione S-transferase N-terminal domain-containing protein [Rhodospirillales bacterium]